MVKCLPTMWETQVQFLVREDPLEKEMATHSRILAWKIPWTEEPGRLQSSEFIFFHFHFCWVQIFTEKKWISVTGYYISILNLCNRKAKKAKPPILWSSNEQGEFEIKHIIHLYYNIKNEILRYESNKICTRSILGKL